MQARLAAAETPNVVGLRNAMAARRQRGGAIQSGGNRADGADPSDAALIVAAVVGGNGHSDAPADRPDFAFINRSNHLLVPTGLALSLGGAGDLVGSSRAKSLKCVAAANIMNLAELTPADFDTRMPVDWQVIGAGTIGMAAYPTVPAPPAGGPMPVAPGPDIDDVANYIDYEDDTKRIDGAGDVIPMDAFNFACGIVSSRSKLNFDFRDVGKLRYTADNKWQHVKEAEPVVHDFESYTMLQIAGLNMPRVGGRPFAAWIRSHGVAYGLLPAPNSKVFKEYEFTTSRSTAEAANECATYAQNLPAKCDLVQLCLNMIAMFGLQHLHKNHTYISNDANMARCNLAYVNALRTISDESVTNEIKQDMEMYMRTAVHPFGLAPTYYLAQWMARRKQLALALGVRTSVAPPPLQRPSIVNAAVKEWGALPVGTVINKVYSESIEKVAKFVEGTEGKMPEYSELARYYAVTVELKVPTSVVQAAEELMPLVYGFALTYHIGPNNERDGLALAMSLVNVKRDYSAVANLLQDLWTKYRDTAVEGGLDNFIARAQAVKTKLAGVAAAIAAPAAVPAIAAP